MKENNIKLFKGRKNQNQMGWGNTRLLLFNNRCYRSPYWKQRPQCLLEKIKTKIEGRRKPNRDKLSPVENAG